MVSKAEEFLKILIFFGHGKSAVLYTDFYPSIVTFSLLFFCTLKIVLAGEQQMFDERDVIGRNLLSYIEVKNCFGLFRIFVFSTSSFFPLNLLPELRASHVSCV